jgi:lipopolysaccharide biosynthesis regulator YciM
LHLVEDKLIKGLEGWLYDYKLSYEVNLKPESNSELTIIQSSIEIIDTELETLNKQLNNMHNLLEQGVYSAETFIDRSNIVKNKIDSLNADKQILVNNIRTKENSKKNKEVLIPKLEKIIEVYGDLNDPEEKNKMLKEALEKVTYLKTVNGRWHNRPDDFKLRFYPKI